MTSRDVERFFQAVSERYPKPLRIVLIGGGASIVQARPRDTEDLDFEVRASVRVEIADDDRPALQAAIAAAKDLLGIKVQFTDLIERWSMIPWPDYQRHVRLWKRFGTCDVFVLDPASYAISKLSRGLESDHDDIVEVMKHHPVPWRTVAALCGRALREAPMSDVLDLFRGQVERFFTRTGPRIWGTEYKSGDAIRVFQQAYRKKGAPRT